MMSIKSFWTRPPGTPQPAQNDGFTWPARLRDRINDMQMHYVSQVHFEQQNVRRTHLVDYRAVGLIGLAVLLISFVTAHSVARRLADPLRNWPSPLTRSAAATFTSACPRPQSPKSHH